MTVFRTNTIASQFNMTQTFILLFKIACLVNIAFSVTWLWRVMWGKWRFTVRTTRGWRRMRCFYFFYSLEIGQNNIEFTFNMIVPNYLLSGHHWLLGEDKTLRGDLWTNLGGGREPLLVHQGLLKIQSKYKLQSRSAQNTILTPTPPIHLLAVQRWREVRDPQARGLPPVQDRLLDHERAHHPKDDLSHEARRVGTQQARKVSLTFLIG